MGEFITFIGNFCKTQIPFQSHERFCLNLKLTSPSVLMENYPVEMASVSRRSYSVMENPTARMNLTKMLVVSKFHFVTITELVLKFREKYNNIFNWFSAVETDPNRAPDCDPTQCVLPDCYCSADGTRIPGGIETSQVPQMITITFNGAVNVDNIDLYEEIFNGQRANPNGCQIRGTFFVSHKYTNYSAVQDLHRKGHEISVFSLTHKDDPQYWSQGSYDDWLAEMAGARLIIERFANITDGSIVGSYQNF